LTIWKINKISKALTKLDRKIEKRGNAIRDREEKIKEKERKKRGISPYQEWKKSNY
jgi:uncharacterized protein (DUF3084 family)